MNKVIFWFASCRECDDFYNYILVEVSSFTTEMFHKASVEIDIWFKGVNHITKFIVAYLTMTILLV